MTRSNRIFWFAGETAGMLMTYAQLGIRYHSCKKLSNALTEPLIGLHKPQRAGTIRRDAVRVSTFVGYFLSKVSGRPLSLAETSNLCLAGALTPVYDSFFDQHHYSEQQLLAITTGDAVPEDHQGPFYAAALTRLMVSIFHLDNYSLQSRRVLRAQLESRRQAEEPDLDEIRRITFEKGGAALLFYSATANEPYSELQQKIIWDFGACVQLIDDIFDLVQDRQNGISTLITLQTGQISAVWEELERLLSENFRQIDHAGLREAPGLKALYHILATPAFSYLAFLERSLQRLPQPVDFNIAGNQLIWQGWKLRDHLFALKYLARIKS